MLVVLVGAVHNLNKDALGLLLRLDITGILATSHQFGNNSLILFLRRIIYNMVNNLFVAENTESPKHYKYGNLRPKKRCIDTNDTPHMI